MKDIIKVKEDFFKLEQIKLKDVKTLGELVHLIHKQKSYSDYICKFLLGDEK